jgi:hypothetical protein
VPTEFIPYLVGRKGATVQKLQKDFDCMVTVPRKGQGGRIKIEAMTELSLIKTKNRLGDLVASAREKQNKHQIILRLTLLETTIKSYKSMREQFVRVQEGQLQFVNQDVFSVKIGNTSLSDTEVKTVEEILAEAQKKLPQDIKIGETDCMEGDKVQQESDP